MNILEKTKVTRDEQMLLLQRRLRQHEQERVVQLLQSHEHDHFFALTLLKFYLVFARFGRIRRKRRVLGRRARADVELGGPCNLNRYSLILK